MDGMIFREILKEVIISDKKKNKVWFLYK